MSTLLQFSEIEILVNIVFLLLSELWQTLLEVRMERPWINEKPFR